MSVETATLLPCPRCGRSAKRITPMGHWLPGGPPHYGPDGVRYVCESLYVGPRRMCIGDQTFYGKNAETEAIRAWNTRTPDHALADELDRLRGEALCYRDMHEIATDNFGYESILEALEDADRLREENAALHAKVEALERALQVIAGWPITHPQENMDAVNMAIIALSMVDGVSALSTQPAEANCGDLS